MNNKILIVLTYLLVSQINILAQDTKYSGGDGDGYSTSSYVQFFNPTSFSATESGVQTITLTWIQNGSSDNVMVAYTSDGTFGTPTDGTSYSVDGSISGGGTVIFNSSGTTANHIFLTGSTTYYYKVWSVNSDNYSTGTTENASISSSVAAILARYDGGSGGGFSSSATSEAALPVELLFFSASYVDNAVKLFWETATEVDNYGFEVEVSTNSTTDSDAEQSRNWKTLGFVEGHGNSNSQKDYSYVDSNPISGINRYKLKQIDTDGSFEYSEIVEVEIDIPILFKLSQNYPNPFNPTTEINYSIPNVGSSGSISSSNVSLKIYDILGREVATLVNEKQTPGNYSVTFNPSQLSSGIYFYSIRTDANASIKKMILLK